MSQFQDLPVELIHEICTYCSKPEIRSLRLTSKLLATIADEHFLEDAIVFFARQDLETAEKVVNNCRIARNVKSITFHADRVPWLGKCFGLWNEFRRQSVRSMAAPDLIAPQDRRYLPGETDRERRLRLRQPNRTLVLESNKYSRKELRAAYEHYNFLSEDQNEMMVEMRAEKCFTHIFENCKKIDKVVVAMHYHHPAWRSVDAFRKGMIHPCGDNLTNRLGVRSLNEVLVAAQATGIRLATLQVYPISFQYFAQDEDRMKLIYAAIDSLKAIILIINDRVVADREVNIEIDDDDPEEMMAARVEEFEREAERESYWDAAARVTGSFRDGRLAKFLSKASSLESIAVAGIETCQTTSTMRLEDIVGSYPWPALREIDLRCFQCREQALLDLLLKYRETLQRLCLGDVLFNTGKSDHFFRAIAGNYPHLAEVELSGEFLSLDLSSDHSEYDFSTYSRHIKSSMESYLLSGGTMPEQEQ